MIAKEYQEILQKELKRSNYLLLTLMVASLQLLKEVKLEVLAEALPIPILFESRRQKIRRFLKGEEMSREKLWFPCVRNLLKELCQPKETIYVAIDRTSWGVVNILMVSVVYQQRAWPVYWSFLPQKGNSNLGQQQEVLARSLQLLRQESGNYVIVVLGDREFCSPKLGDWLRKEGVYFSLRQKCNTKIEVEKGLYRELRECGLNPGMKLFFQDRQITKQKGFGTFNLAGKWKRSYRGFKTKEPWYILTNLPDVETAIRAYQKPFDIEEMFRDFKLGGYNLEGSQLSSHRLNKLMIVVSIAYTSAMLQGKNLSVSDFKNI